jgi:hypothetical protein
MRVRGAAHGRGWCQVPTGHRFATVWSRLSPAPFRVIVQRASGFHRHRRDLLFYRVRAGHDWSDHWLTGVPAVRVASVTTSTGRTRRTVVLSRRGAIRCRGDWTGALRRMRRKMVGLHREPGGSSRQRRAGLATNGSAAGPKGAAGFSRGPGRLGSGRGAVDGFAAGEPALMLTAEGVLRLAGR